MFLALRQGEDAALNQLVARWEQPLFAFAWRYLHNTADAQDAVADTFVRLYQNRERLREDTNLSAWLFTTLANRCRNQHRWRKRHPSVSYDDPEDDAGHAVERQMFSAPTAATAMEADESYASLRAAVDRLQHELKTVVLLFYFEHLSYREIAAITGCSERGVETRLYRARNRLRAEVECVRAVV